MRTEYRYTGSAAQRYKAFQLAHGRQGRLLFPLLLMALVAIWSISLLFASPSAMQHFGSTGLYHSACAQAPAVDKLDQKEKKPGRHA